MMPVRSGVVVEVTGVAGAGKSTLVDHIARADPRVQVADFIHMRKPAHLLRASRALPTLLPLLARGLTQAPRLEWPDLKLLAYASAWHGRVRPKGGPPAATVLLDQGPLYALVRLEAKGSRVTASAAFREWWQETLDTWSRTLDAVVYLDAADDVLWSRINERRQGHGTKGSARSAGLAFIARYRELFGELLQRLERDGRVDVLRFDTGESRAIEVADEVQRNLRRRSKSAGIVG